MSMWGPSPVKAEYTPTEQDKAFCIAEGCIVQVRDPETRDITYLNRCPRCNSLIDTVAYQLQAQRMSRRAQPEQYYEYSHS